MLALLALVLQAVVHDVLIPAGGGAGLASGDGDHGPLPDGRELLCLASY